MDPTNRVWAIAGMASFLAFLAVILAQPLFLVGTILLGVWLLTRQYVFFRSVQQLVDGLTVQQIPNRTSVYADESVSVTLAAETSEPTTLDAHISAGFPPGATGETALELSLSGTSKTLQDTVAVSWPVAGRHQFSEATLTVTDGFFSQSVPVGDQPTVTVEQPGPDQLHVGQGGNERSIVYGEHTTDRKGPGIEPAELRAYVPGDTVEQIDWNATARLNEPYVREFEVKSDRQTILVFDHRESLADGPPGASKLDYLRAAALALTEYTATLDDPLGLVAVGDAGITQEIAPSTRADQYETVRESLLALSPTSRGPAVDSAEEPADQSMGSRTLQRTEHRAELTLRERHRVSALLAQSDDSFAKTLAPFFERQPEYIRQIDAKPLFGAVETATINRAGHGLTVICTDDSNRVEIVEAVRRSTHDGGVVLVLLVPSVLFESAPQRSLDEQYRRYLDFEEFRQDLDSREAVTALEIAPGDRLDTLLAMNHSTGRSQRGEHA